ncbi:MAG: FAD-dependent oxidoreductase, partial [Gammaproteobacteria bacterium]|nr:FAD-dependent oxidoreductase [Gammaproteobacteria bacterium]
MTVARWFVAVFVASAITLFFIYDLDGLLQLSQLKAQQESLAQMVADQPVESAVFFMAAYILVTGLSLPGATLMTLLAGALFGFYYGSLIVSFASTIGATLAMLTSRFLIREWVESRFSGQAKKINSGMLKEGAYYLFSLRLIPLIPFFVINLALGLTRIRVSVFYVVSQLGMLPATFIYVNAGQELARLDSFEDILSIELLSALLLLAVFPMATKRLVEMFRKRKLRLRFHRPREFDNDIVVIGAGSGGLVSALIGATVNAKVTLIEENQMGGDCLNTGCVPSKSLIRAANLMADIGSADEFGIQVDSAKLDFAEVMARVRGVIKQIEPNDSVERYEAMGVDVRTGHAEIISPFEVAVGGKSITTRNIVVATGAAPIWIEIDGLPADRCFTSETIWNLTELPANLIVIGAGAIGVELSQAFARLGSKVTLVEQADRILVNEDVDVSERISQCLQNDAIEIKTNYRALRAETDGNGIHLVCQGEEQAKIPFDAVLLALGRLPRTKGFGLENLGVELLDNGAIKVDEYLRTQYDNIYAVG